MKAVLMGLSASRVGALWPLVYIILTGGLVGCAEGLPPAVRTESPCLVSVVIDGDSLRCVDGREIRLLLIDAPESGQAPWGDQARTVLLGLAPPGAQLDVEYDIERSDTFERDLAYLYRPDGAMLSERMAWLGYAVALVIPPNGLYEGQIRAAVASAEAEGRGLWAEWKFDCLPVDYRAGRCT